MSAYRHAYVPRTPPAHRPSALAFGSAFHEALAAFYGQLGEGEGEMPVEELLVYQIVMKTRKPAVDIHRVSRGESDMEEVHRVVDGVLRAVEVGVFWPSRGWP